MPVVSPQFTVSGGRARVVATWEYTDSYVIVPTNGTINGTVVEDTDPVPFAMVHCYFRRTGAYVTSTRCDAGGNFTLSGLDPTTPADVDDGKYYVVALDPRGGARYNALIYDRVVPS